MQATGSALNATLRAVTFAATIQGRGVLLEKMVERIFRPLCNLAPSSSHQNLARKRVLEVRRRRQSFRRETHQRVGQDRLLLRSNRQSCAANIGALWRALLRRRGRLLLCAARGHPRTARGVRALRAASPRWALRRSPARRGGAQARCPEHWRPKAPTCAWTCRLQTRTSTRRGTGRGIRLWGRKADASVKSRGRINRGCACCRTS
mmetsp:Transcript_75355/g.196366  ORF Transcript_75355/g.196366 Transcript_75355/m.196366 type:complete len:206 (-) Transcript_75355:180-797(-)